MPPRSLIAAAEARFARTCGSVMMLPSAMPCMLTEPSLMLFLVTPTSVLPFLASEIFWFSAF